MKVDWAVSGVRTALVLCPVDADPEFAELEDAFIIVTHRVSLWSERGGSDWEWEILIGYQCSLYLEVDTESTMEGAQAAALEAVGVFCERCSYKIVEDPR